MNRRHSYTPYRGPIISNPDAGLLPNPWEEPFTVPKASPRTWVKGIILLGVGVVFTLWGLGVFQ